MSVPSDLQHRLLLRSAKVVCNSNLKGLSVQCRVHVHGCVCVCVCVCVCARAHACSSAYSGMPTSAHWLTVAGQAPLSVVFSRQESCSGLSFPPPEDLPHPGTEPGSPAWAGGLLTVWATTRGAPNYPVYYVYVYVHKRFCFTLELATFLFEVFWYAVLIWHVTRINLILWNEIKYILKDQGNNLFLSSAAAAKLPQSCPTLRLHRGQPTRLPRPWDSPGKNTGVGCHFLLQCMKVKSESEVSCSVVPGS